VENRPDAQDMGITNLTASHVCQIAIEADSVQPKLGERALAAHLLSRCLKVASANMASPDCGFGDRAGTREEWR
jgi:hypothetical protein